MQLAELGLLPEGDADPLTLCDKLTQLAIDANDEEVRRAGRQHAAVLAHQFSTATLLHAVAVPPTGNLLFCSLCAEPGNDCSCCVVVLPCRPWLWLSARGWLPKAVEAH